MAAVKLKLLIEQGATFKKHMVWRAGEPLTPVNLISATARMHVISSLDDPAILLTLTTENGGVTLGGDTGSIDLYIPASITETITWEDAIYDLEIILPATPEPDVRRLVYGPVHVSREATRD